MFSVFFTEKLKYFSVWFIIYTLKQKAVIFMIIGTKKNINTYKGLTKNMDTAIDFVLAMDENIECGRYTVDEDDIFAVVSEGYATTEGEILYETHETYLDLQYILKGDDTVWYADADECEVKVPYESERDVTFLTCDKGQTVKFKAGDFYILHPFDAHAPCRGDEPKYYKKVVVKVKI